MRSLGFKEQPILLAGHSLGEFSAGCAGGAFSVAQGAFLVRKRGEFMQTTVPEGTGGMTAVIGLDEDTIEEILSTTSYFVQVANYNSNEQVVISGELEALNEVEPKLLKAGAKRVVRLPVSAPFHSRLMKKAGEMLKELMEEMEFKPLRIPVLNNVDVKLVRNPDELKDSFYRQVFSPVRWKEDVLKMVSLGVDTVYEIGPKNVLRGLIRRIDRGLKVVNVE
jgi:[acyl-carrier-protein] S-malonyltransferase